MPQAFYHVGSYPLCGSCGSQCSPDFEENLRRSGTPMLGKYHPVWYCANKICPQRNVKFETTPIEATVVNTSSEER